MLTEVLSIACLTEDRAPGEQRAMLDLALILDMGRGAFLHNNRELYPPTLVAHVEATYDPGKGVRQVSLTKAQREKYARLLERWARCDRCGWPAGMHYGNDDPKLNCPPDDNDFADRLTAWRISTVPPNDWTESNLVDAWTRRDVQDTLPL